MRRGATIGAKWMAIILGIPFVLMWTIVLALFLYRWLWLGMSFSYLVEVLDFPTGIGLTLGTIVVPTFWAAVICALIMGAGYGVSYRKPTPCASNSRLSQGPPAGDQPSTDG
jgi:hypothetical protein